MRSETRKFPQQIKVLQTKTNWCLATNTIILSNSIWYWRNGLDTFYHKKRSGGFFAITSYKFRIECKILN